MTTVFILVVSLQNSSEHSEGGYNRLSRTTSRMSVKSHVILWKDNKHGLHDGLVFTIDRSSKSQRLSDIEEQRLPVCKFFAVFYFWVLC